MGQRKANKWVRAGVALLLILATYLMGSRALDTGSLGQYTLTLVLIILSVRQTVSVFKK